MMKQNRKLITKGEAHISNGPFKKATQLLRGGRNRALAGILSFAVLLGMIPTGAFIVLAADNTTFSTVNGAVDVGSLTQPMMGIGARSLPEGGRASVYYGQYPQDSADANSKQPILWDTVTKNRDVLIKGKEYYPLNSMGAIALVSKKVLDTSTYMSWKSSWKYNSSNFDLPYGKSQLHSFLNYNFASSAFSDSEEATLSTDPVVVMGGNFSYSNESVPCTVFAPDLYMQGQPYVGNAFGVNPVSEMTPYARSRGCTEKDGLPIYWLRTVPCISGLLNINHGISSQGMFVFDFDDTRRMKLGVRPMTRIMLDTILFTSEAGLKANESSLNGQIDGAREYELTVLEKDREFVATQTGTTTYNGDVATMNMTYSGAKTGADEYISYVMTDEYDNVLQYKRLLPVKATSGSFTLNVSASSIYNSKAKIKILNEKIGAGNSTDYGSPFSEFDVEFTKSARPNVVESNRRKTTPVQKEITFELLDKVYDFSTGSFAVYEDSLGTVRSKGMTASYDNSSKGVKLSHASDIALGDYYLGYRENGALWSNPVKLTVETTNRQIYLYYNRYDAFEVDNVQLDITKDVIYDGYSPPNTVEEIKELKLQSCAEHPKFNSPTRYVTTRWNTRADGSGHWYNVGDSFRMSDIDKYSIDRSWDGVYVLYPEVKTFDASYSITQTPDEWTVGGTKTVNAQVITDAQKLGFGPVLYSWNKATPSVSGNQLITTKGGNTNIQIKMLFPGTTDQYYEILNLESTNGYVVKIENDKPDMTNFISNPNETGTDALYFWTQSTHKIDMQIDNGEWKPVRNTNGTLYDVEKNGTYTFRVTSLAGQQVTKTVVYTKINPRPVLEINSDGMGVGFAFATGDIKLNFSNVGEEINGSTTYKYRIRNGEWQDCSEQLIINSDVNAETPFIFKAISGGKESNEKQLIIRRDATPPEISVKDGAVYCGSQDIVVEDNAIHCLSMEKGVTVNGTAVKLTEILDRNKGSFTLTSSDKPYEIVATDLNGWVSRRTITINPTHTLGDYLGDCTADILCKFCDELMSEGEDTHALEETLQHDNSQHWYSCQNEDCEVKSVEPHSFGASAFFDETNHKTICECGEERLESHSGGIPSYVAEGVCTTCDEKYLEKLVDSTSPTAEIQLKTNSWKSFLNVITFGLYFNEEQEITVTATDDGIGLDKCFYYLSNVDLSKDDMGGVTGWTEIQTGGTFSLNPDNKVVVYVKATDKAGNTTYIRSDGIVLDATAPIISNVAGNPISFVSVEPSITFEVTEAYIDSVSYAKNTGEYNTLTQSNGKYSFVATENATYKVKVVDNAGNETIETISVSKIDKIAPTISASGDTDTYKTSDKATVAVTVGISGIAQVEVQKNSGEWADITTSYQSGYEITANGSYIFRVTNGAGVAKTSTLSYAKIDSAKPVISINSNGYTEDSWKNNGDITLAVANDTANLGTTKIEYKIGNGAWQDYVSNIVISDDCLATVYTFKATSAAGVVSDEKGFTVKRDTAIPENMSVTYQQNGWKEFLNVATFGLFFNDTVTVKISATDTGSGVKEFKYTLNGSTEKTVMAANASGTFTIEPQYKGNISGVIAIDNAGNETGIVATEHFAVDSQNPIAPKVEMGEYTSGKWTKEDVTFTISGSSATSGIAKYQVSTDNGANWADLTATEKTDATATEASNVKKANITLSEDVDGVDYQFRAVSNAGNEGAVSSKTKVKIDKIAPTISASGDTDTYKTSDKATVAVTVGISGIARVEVQKNSGEWADITTSYQSGYEITANGSYIFRVTNGAGVAKTSTLSYAKIDSAKPVVSINSNGYTEDSWKNNGDITLAVANDTANLGTTKIEYKIGNGAWQDYVSNIVISDDCLATVYTFKATSAAGVVSDEKGFTVKRDTAIPEGDIEFNVNSVKKIINQITFGLLYKDEVNVKLMVSDVTSGVKRTEYFKSDKVLEQSDVEAITDWKAGTSFSVTPIDRKRFIIYVKVTDNAGNVTIFGSDGATFDTISPAVTGVIDGETYYTTQKARVIDDNLKLLTVNGVEVMAPTVEIQLDGNKVENYIIKAVDKVGNEITYSVTMKSISSLSSTIDILTAENVKSSDTVSIEMVKSNIKAVDIAEATLAEKDELTAIDAKCDTLLKKVDDTAKKIETITNAINSYKLDAVKFSDRTAVGQLKSEIKVLTDSKNLTVEENAALVKVGDTAQSILQRILNVAVASTPASYNTVKNVNKENVKLSDKNAIDKAKLDFIKAIADFGGNYTNAETEIIQGKLKQLNDVLDVIKSTQKAIDMITSLPAEKTITVQDAAVIRGAKKAYDVLSNYEKSLVEESLVSKLNKVCTALVNLSLKDDATSVSIEAIGETILDIDTKLVISAVEPSDAHKRGVQIVASDNKIISLYNLSLQLNGEKIQPNGDVQVTLPLTTAAKDMTGLQAIYIDDSGKVTIIPCTVADGKITFITTHFSYYGIIGKLKVVDTDGSKPAGDGNTTQNSGISYIFIGSSALLIIVSAVVAMGIYKKRRKVSTKQ